MADNVRCFDLIVCESFESDQLHPLRVRRAEIVATTKVGIE